MIYITQICLENWFNYRGAFEDNVIPLERGVNFFCADNNAGKSKLHNAIRWVLTDEVILNSQLEEITKENIDQVVNRSYYRRLNAGESFQFGVQLDYTKRSGHDESRFRILKKVKGSKDGQWTIQVEVLKPGRGNGWIKSNDNETVNRAHFIPLKFQRYLFLEGEQLNHLIPFHGPKLNATIDDITNIASIDKRIQQAKGVKKALETLISEQTKRLSSGDQILQQAIEKKDKLGRQLDDCENDISAISDELLLLQNEKNSLKNESLKIKETQDAIKELDKFDIYAKAAQKQIENLEDEYYLNISKKFKTSEFLLANQSTSFINETYRELINEFIATRKSQLDEDIDEEKQKMVARLIKNQPGIEILNEIVEGKSCFVCGTAPISHESETYIKEHLIPHFSGEFDREDNQLTLFNAIIQLANSVIKGTQNFQPDNEALEHILDQIAEKQSEYDNIEANRLDFIQKNGDPRDLKNDHSILDEYDHLSGQISDKETELNSLTTIVDKLRAEIKDTQKTIKQNSNQNDDLLQKLTTASTFQEKLYKKLKSIKDSTYKEFCSKLEEESTKRLHRYFGNNPGISASGFKVLVEKTITDKYNFEISVQDQQGNQLTDPGGAETKIRQYCVVLSLVELANESSGQIGNFPFIVDAPISQLNTDYRLQFYMSLLEETVNPQTIILTYDLVTGAPDSSINRDGDELLQMMRGEYSGNSGYMLFKQDRDAKVVKHKLA